jgi:hypothetical protein
MTPVFQYPIIHQLTRDSLFFAFAGSYKGLLYLLSPIAMTLYSKNVSQSMEYPNSQATGAAMTPSTFRKYAKEAGFSKVDILSIEHFMWQFYRLTK